MVGIGAGPTDDQLIADAVAEARTAGMRKSEIARVMDEVAALDDGIGRGAFVRLAREARRATSCRRLVQSITKREDSFMRPTTAFVHGVAFADFSNWGAETSCT